MSWKRGALLVVLVVVVLLFVLGERDWAIAIVIGLVVLGLGRITFPSLRSTVGPTGPALDVADEGTLLVFACETCGEQLVLLRRGTEVPPRHCAEQMVLRRIPVPDQKLN
jgi:hypothetical protein